MEEFKIFSLKDETGEEKFFLIAEEVDLNGKKYWLCSEVKLNLILGDEYIFSVQEDSDEIKLESVEDEEELDIIYSKLLEKINGS